MLPETVYSFLFDVFLINLMFVGGLLFAFLIFAALPLTLSIFIVKQTQQIIRRANVW